MKKNLPCNVQGCAENSVGHYTVIGMKLCKKHYLEGHTAIDETIGQMTKSKKKSPIKWVFWDEEPE